MGKRGPSPKPESVRLAEGTFRADRHGRNNPKPAIAAIEAPAWLDDVAREKFAERVRVLQPLGLVTELDGDALAAYCQAWSEFRRAAELLADQDLASETKGGATRSNPLIATKNNAAKLIMQFGSRFGMTPSDRVGWDVPKQRQGVRRRDRA